MLKSLTMRSNPTPDELERQELLGLADGLHRAFEGLGSTSMYLGTATALNLQDQITLVAACVERLARFVGTRG